MARGHAGWAAYRWGIVGWVSMRRRMARRRELTGSRHSSSDYVPRTSCMPTWGGCQTCCEACQLGIGARHFFQRHRQLIDHRQLVDQSQLHDQSQLVGESQLASSLARAGTRSSAALAAVECILRRLASGCCGLCDLGVRCGTQRSQNHDRRRRVRKDGGWRREVLRP